MDSARNITSMQEQSPALLQQAILSQWDNKKMHPVRAAQRLLFSAGQADWAP